MRPTPGKYLLKAGSLSMEMGISVSGASASFDDFTYDSVNDAFTAIHAKVVIQFTDSTHFTSYSGQPPDGPLVRNGTYAPTT